MKTGYLTIGTNPDGAKVYIDNVLVLDENNEPVLSPVVLVVSEGYHDIILELEGYCIESDGQYIMDNETINIFHNFYIC